MSGGVKTCLCQRRKAIRSTLTPPPLFGKPKLSRLVGRCDKHPSQAIAVAQVKREPDASYVFCGRNGSGKTHISWALCRHALIQGRRIRAVLLEDLMGQWREWEIDESAKRPVVVVDDLKLGPTYTIFLDEFEKVKPSEFASRRLFEFLNAVRDFKHQLLVTSNKEWGALQRHWSTVDPIYGSSIMTRLMECRLIELF